MLRTASVLSFKKQGLSDCTGYLHGRQTHPQKGKGANALGEAARASGGGRNPTSHILWLRNFPGGCDLLIVVVT